MFALLMRVLRGFEALGGRDPGGESEAVEVTDLDDIRITVPVDLLPQFEQVEVQHIDDPLYQEQFTWEFGAHGLRELIDIARAANTPDEAVMTIFANTRFPRDEDGNVDFEDIGL